MAQKSKKILLPLHYSLLVGACAAAGGFYTHALARPYIFSASFVDYIPLNMTPRQEMIASYVLVFLCTFLLMSWLTRHVSVKYSSQPKGEKASGRIPRLARLILAAFLFTVPLFILLQDNSKPKESLRSLIDRAMTAQDPIRDGYQKNDRASLDALIQTGDTHE